MTTQTAPIRRRKLGIRLLELRKMAGLSQDDAAEWTGLSQAAISRIESAKQVIEVKHVRLLAQCYGVGAPEVDQLLRMASEADDRGLLVTHSDTVPDFARDYVELETYASELWVCEPGWVFGLFQIPEYVRAVRLAAHPDATESELERSVSLRTDRQGRLIGDRPPRLRVVLDEAVLHRAVGGPKVMAAQLRHLIDVSMLPNITLQVMPFAVGAHPAVGAGFTVLRVDLFEALSRRALGPEDTRSLLATLASDLWEQQREVEA